MILKIVTFNINKGKGALHLAKNSTIPLKLIAHKDFDLIMLQECEESAISALQDDYFYFFSRTRRIKDRWFGNCTLSRFKIIRTQNFNISTNRLEQRGMQYIEIMIEDNPIHIINTHFNLLQKGRNQQLLLLKEIIEKIPTNQRVLITGDFNDWNEKIATSNTLKEMNFNISTPLKTFPSLFPKLVLDRIFSKNIVILSSEILGAQTFRFFSDHLPIYTKIKINE